MKARHSLALWWWRDDEETEFIIQAALRPTLALVFFVVSSHLNVAYAAFEDHGVGARAPGMADAFVGVADDANALYYNPAGLAQLPSAEINAQLGRLNLGLDDGSELGTAYLGYAQPLKGGNRGTLGLGYHDFKLTSLYSERTLFLSYGWKPKWQPFPAKGNLLTGATLKHLHRSFSPNAFTANALNDAGLATDTQDPVFASNGFSTDDFALDFGSMYRFGEDNRFNVGLQFMNLNQPDVSLAGDGDKPPLIAKLGLGYKPEWGTLSAEVRRAKRLEGKSDTEVALGLERRFNFKDSGALEFRTGYAEGSREFKKVTAGFSYLFRRTQLDYSFNIPIGNLNDTQGSHRVAFSFRWGGRYKDAPVEEKLDDLLRAFSHNASATHVLIKRAKENNKINGSAKQLFLHLMMHLYDPNTPAMNEVRADLLEMNRNQPQSMIDWISLKALLLRNLSDQDRSLLNRSLDDVSQRRYQSALIQTGLLSVDALRKRSTIALKLMILANLGAETFRAKDIDSTLHHVRQMMDTLPADPVIKKAYQELLLMKSDIQTPVKKPALPEAPAVLVAPKPVVTSTVVIQGLTDFEAKLQSFRNALGYYFTRKQEGASLVERRHLLRQMLKLYGDSGIDMSLVERELKEVEAALKPKPKKKPVVKKKPAVKKPAPKKPVVKKKPAPKPKAKPKKKKNIKVITKKLSPVELETEVQRAWRFYRRAVDRGLTDAERIEILGDILFQFGENEAKKIIRELNRIRRRVERERQAQLE